MNKLGSVVVFKIYGVKKKALSEECFLFDIITLFINFSILDSKNSEALFTAYNISKIKTNTTNPNK